MKKLILSFFLLLGVLIPSFSFAAIGDYIYYSNSDDGSKLYKKSANDTSNGSAINSTNSQYLGSSPDGNYILYRKDSDQKTYKKSANDTSDGSIIVNVPSWSAQYSPDGNYIYYFASDGKLYKKSANDTSNGSAIISTSASSQNGFSVSSDGNYIVYTRAGNLYKKSANDISDGNVITTGSCYKLNPVFSPDNNYIVYSNCSDSNKLYKKSANDTSNGSAITSTFVYTISIAYSPDGNYIVYSNANDGYKLYKKSANDTSNGSAITSVSSHYTVYGGIYTDSCTDGIKNQDEVQIDWGGVCGYSNPPPSSSYTTSTGSCIVNQSLSGVTYTEISSQMILSGSDLDEYGQNMEIGENADSLFSSINDVRFTVSDSLYNSGFLNASIAYSTGTFYGDVNGNDGDGDLFFESYRTDVEYLYLYGNYQVVSGNVVYVDSSGVERQVSVSNSVGDFVYRVPSGYIKSVLLFFSSSAKSYYSNFKWGTFVDSYLYLPVCVPIYTSLNPWVPTNPLPYSPTYNSGTIQGFINSLPNAITSTGAFQNVDFMDVSSCPEIFKDMTVPSYMDDLITFSIGGYSFSIPAPFESIACPYKAFKFYTSKLF